MLYRLGLCGGGSGDVGMGNYRNDKVKLHLGG